MSDTVTTDTTEKTPKWQENALRMAGYGYSVGDLAMAAAAKVRGEKNVMGGALIWLAGGVTAARYGHPDADAQVKLLAHKLDQHLHDQGITIPEDIRHHHALLKKPDFVQKCQNFLYHYPSEVLNAAYGIGAMLLLKDGVGELVRQEKRLFPVFAGGLKTQSVLAAANGISKNFWMGALIGGGAIAGIAIKEDPEAKKRAAHGNILQKAVAHIEEKPLRLTGTLYGLNNIFTVLKAVEDHSRFSGAHGMLKPHYFSGTTAATYILSNVLLATVSRGRGTRKGLEQGRLALLEDAAVRVIAVQPEEKRQELLSDMAEFLSKQKEVGQSKDQIQMELTKQFAALSVRPAVQAPASWAARTAVRDQADSLQV